MADRIFGLSTFATPGYGGTESHVSTLLSNVTKKLTKLVHSPETGVETLTYIDASTATKGDIVAIKTTDHSAALSAAGGTYPIAVAICIDSSVLTNNKGKFRTLGEAQVKLVTGLTAGNTPTNGKPIYLSATAGKGTTVSAARQIGFITDASGYAVDETVKILIDKGCVAAGPRVGPG